MHGIVTPESALKLARLEENYQMEEWGLVEGGHDIDEADYAVRVTAPLVFQQFLKE
jgi:ATP synthase F1 complex assembly factor 2